MRPRRSFLVAVAVLLTVPLSATPPPVTVPVPEGDLRGNSLLLRDRELAIDAPGPQWTWFRYLGMNTFFARRSPHEHAAYVIVGDGHTAEGSRLKAHVKGSRKYFQSSGYRVVDVRETQSEVPFTGTQHVSVHAVSKSGSTLYEYSYLLPMGVTLQALSPHSPEPAWIREWVASSRKEGRIAP
jgi:hypothetical protein